MRGVELDDGTLLPATIVVSTSSLRTTVCARRRAALPRGATSTRVEEHPRLVHRGAGEDRPEEEARRGRAHRRRRRRTGRPRLACRHARHEGDVQRASRTRRGAADRAVLLPGPDELRRRRSRRPATSSSRCARSRRRATSRSSDPRARVGRGDAARRIRRVVPGLDEHTLFVDTLLRRASSRSGSARSSAPPSRPAQTPDQVGKNRPPVYTPLRGLYLAGCNAGARGVGTELAAASAMECVDRILVDLGRDVPGRAQKRSRNVAFATLGR